ncbi:hypothetical protein [uncultured Fusobacterium sp.]|uniref:hypothetical protein n=1 Tax=uncultured Fusobacterium sp. TaxID=159267 RepID=UPI0025F84F01|nr:hypothetical protein [uncultured Fusobacterium sp.]
MTREEFRNLEVGETFQLGCKKFTVIENDEDIMCEGCFFDEEVYSHCGQMAKYNFIPECCEENRKDEKNVIFVEVEDESSVEF